MLINAHKKMRGDWLDDALSCFEILTRIEPLSIFWSWIGHMHAQTIFLESATISSRTGALERRLHKQATRRVASLFATMTSSTSGRDPERPIAETEPPDPGSLREALQGFVEQTFRFWSAEARRSVGLSTPYISHMGRHYGIRGGVMDAVLSGRLPCNIKQVYCLVRCANVLWPGRVLFDLILWCAGVVRWIPKGTDVGRKMRLDDAVQQNAGFIIKSASKKNSGTILPARLMEGRVRFSPLNETLQVTATRVSNNRQEQTVPNLSPELAIFFSYECFFARKCLGHFGSAIQNLIDRKSIGFSRLSRATGISEDKLKEMYVPMLMQLPCARRPK